MSNASFTVSSPTDIAKILDYCKVNYPQYVMRAARQEISAIFQESQMYVPVDEGNLRASGRHRTYQDGSTIRAQISYRTDYAIYVHERLDLHHRHPTKAKFLEDPIRAHFQTMQENLSRRVMDMFWDGHHEATIQFDPQAIPSSTGYEESQIYDAPIGGE